jgi:hypothetical protein
MSGFRSGMHRNVQGKRFTLGPATPQHRKFAKPGHRLGRQNNNNISSLEDVKIGAAMNGDSRKSSARSRAWGKGKADSVRSGQSHPDVSKNARRQGHSPVLAGHAGHGGRSTVDTANGHLVVQFLVSRSSSFSWQVHNSEARSTGRDVPHNFGVSAVMTTPQNQAYEHTRAAQRPIIPTKINLLLIHQRSPG